MFLPTLGLMFKGAGVTCCSLPWREQILTGDGSVIILTCVTHLMPPSLALIYTSAQRGCFLAHYL